jgi:hypothetical protein
MDKFEHEKHNRRERVYKFPKINLTLTEKQAEQKERERIAQREADISQLRCLALYRDFFRNPRNYKHVQEYGSKRRLQNLPDAYEEDLLKGQKEFSKLVVNSAKYREYMTPLDFYWSDESNKINYENYRAGVEAIREEEAKAKNLSMLEALKRHRFEAD